MDFLKKISTLRSLADSWCEGIGIPENSSSRLGDVCRYSLLSGGKRVRPILCLLTGELVRVENEHLKHIAVALELVHTSSLIHDDLPGLDNDDTRRGKPSCHAAHGEGLAILAGDALLARAFHLLGAAGNIEASARAEWVELLAGAAEELCHGQTIDLDSGTAAARALRSSLPVEEQESRILDCHRRKTGALFRCAALAPLALLGESERQDLRPAFFEIGEEIGLLFQMTDDLLDSPPGLRLPGEAGGEGVSIVSVLGTERTQELIEEKLSSIRSRLEPFAQHAEIYMEFVNHLAKRGT